MTSTSPAPAPARPVLVSTSSHCTTSPANREGGVASVAVSLGQAAPTSISSLQSVLKLFSRLRVTLTSSPAPTRGWSWLFVSSEKTGWQVAGSEGGSCRARHSVVQ